MAAPTYVVTTVSLDKDQGTELVNAAINAITLKISSLGGSLEVKHAVCDARLAVLEYAQLTRVLCQARAVNASEEGKTWEDEAKDLSAENSQGEDDEDPDDADE